MKYAFETNPGKVREKNEDTCLIVENKYGDVLMMVLDGMGGHSKGDLASNKAKEYISSQFVDKHFFSFKIKSWIKKVLRKTNSMLFRLSNEQPRLKGMGTTVTLFLIHKNKTYLSYIGDSRGYIVKGDNIIQKSVDETYVEFLFEQGKITRDEMLTHPQRNVLTNSLGGYDKVQVNILEITDNYYNTYTDWSVVNFSDEVKALIEKIGYYGYDYPGHQTNYYYIAAQELIWKAVNPNVESTWTTEENYGGKVIDISKEKEEIMSLVKSHDLKPSFSEKLFKGEVGSTITLEDENNVLDDYDIMESENHDIVKEDNKLIIHLNEEVRPLEKISLKRRHYDDAPLLVYSKGNSQKLSALRITYDKDSYFSLLNEEVPEIVEVPNTGSYNFALGIGTLLVGVGLVLAKIY